MDEGIANEVFDCPRGCGTLDYQSTAGKFHDGIKGLVGKGLIIISITIFVVYIAWSMSTGNSTNENIDIGQLFMVITICVVILTLGGIIGGDDSWNHHCQTCNGVLMDPKAVSEVFWGEDGTKIISLMEEIGDSVGDLNCPGCGERMDVLPIPYAQDKNIHGDFLITLIVTAGNLISEEILEIDVCNECMMLWFDRKEAMVVHRNSMS